VVDLPTAAARQVDALIDEGIARGLRTIGLPWERQMLKGMMGSTRRVEFHPSGFARRRWNAWPTSWSMPPFWRSCDEL